MLTSSPDFPFLVRRIHLFIHEYAHKTDAFVMNTDIPGDRDQKTGAVDDIKVIGKWLDIWGVKWYEGWVREGSDIWSISWKHVKPPIPNTPDMGGEVRLEKVPDDWSQRLEGNRFSVSFQFASWKTSIATIIERGCQEPKRMSSYGLERMKNFSTLERAEHTKSAINMLEKAMIAAKTTGQTEGFPEETLDMLRQQVEANLRRVFLAMPAKYKYEPDKDHDLGSWNEYKEAPSEVITAESDGAGSTVVDFTSKSTAETLNIESNSEKLSSEYSSVKRANTFQTEE